MDTKALAADLRMGGHHLCSGWTYLRVAAMSESTPEEIAATLTDQIAAIREAKGRLARAMHAEREGARNRAQAEADIRTAHLVIAHLLRGAVGEEFFEVYSRIRGQ